jgi:hypothetical protein
MSFNARLNALDQALDVQGSARQEQARTLLDEFNQLGHIRAGVTSAIGRLITGAPAGQMRVSASAIFDSTNLSDRTNFLQVSGALTGSNNGVFLIVNVVDANTVDVVNASAAVPDGNNGAITVQEYFPYALEDDLNYTRTDRAAIKGTTNWYDGIPTYVRTTALGTNVTASLQNIAGKTTDAMSLNRNLRVIGSGSFSGSLSASLKSVGNLKHSDNVDKTGVPIFDSAQNTFNADTVSCYVEINSVDSDNEFTVLSGSHVGEKIFGLTTTGSAPSASITPDSVFVSFYSVPHGGNISTDKTAYSWEAGLPLTAAFYIGYNQRLDQLDINALRSQLTLGIESDADLRKDVNDMQQVVGTADGAVSLAGLLTNTGANFLFDTLSATPSVVAALNALNANVGDRTYTGPYLTSNQTIVASLQALSNAVSAVTASEITRYLTRLTGTVPAGVAIPTPAAYVLDGTNQGKGLAVWTRGILRDPGSAANNDDYSETTTGSVTFFSKMKASDHINWFVI